jgi:Xaa-Pro aminopeptidase
MKQILKQRRQKLAELCYSPAILWSGGGISRNFPANRYPFRASSHFLYFAGISVEHAAIRLDRGRLELFVDDPAPSSILWQGATPSREEMAQAIGADRAYPFAELAKYTKDAATLPVQDARTYDRQGESLNRFLTLEGIDLDLARAIVTLRLAHDAAALEELKKAASVAVKCHLAGMEATPDAKTEAQVRAAMEAAIIAENMTCAYNSIVTVHGEILHNDRYHHSLERGDLLLADVGAETALGWASDVTRTWPVSGRFSPTQRDIYQVVLAAHDACLGQMRPGVEYREIHLLAARVMAEGLVNLGILRGDPDTLVEIDAHALFFPHGIGHLLGLVVHDLEDLGDLAGYADGRTRSHRFGLGYLRLDRPLRSQMLVTIEPGFYQVPAILGDSDNRDKYRSVVNWERLAQFADVRGIRIEDDVLITDKGIEILTAALPAQVDEIEARL